LTYTQVYTMIVVEHQTGLFSKHMVLLNFFNSETGKVMK